MVVRMQKKRLGGCCTGDREQLSIDFDAEYHQQPDQIMTYDGLESCILNSHSYRNHENASSSVSIEQHGHAMDSLDDDVTSCCSSSNVLVSSSSVSRCVKNNDDQQTNPWESPQQQRFLHHSQGEKSAYLIDISDADSMKEIFSKLLLGEDFSGGTKGFSSARSLSNAITGLAVSTFGELWKLEPLPEEKKLRWRKEIDWFLSPANYMVELVPAKQSAGDGRTFEIMTPRARADVHMNLPALQKLDSMLIETLDSMEKTEFWYSEGSSNNDQREGCDAESKRWWLPYPRVPARGLSDYARKKLIAKGNLVHQVFKASKAINQSVLSEMPVPNEVKDALPKAGRACLGERLYNILAQDSIWSTAIDMADSLKLKSDHEALDIINKLESALLVWRDKLIDQASKRKSWSFSKGPTACNVDKIESLLFRLEALLQELRTRYPSRPHTFLDMTKIQYSKDVGHLIMEAYSRVLSNLAYNILLRIADILQEDRSSNPTSPIPMSCFTGMLVSPKWTIESPAQQLKAKRSLVDEMSRADSHNSSSYYFSSSSDSNPSMRSSDIDISSASEARSSSSVMTTPSVSRIWCVGGDGCSSGSPCRSP